MGGWNSTEPKVHAFLKIKLNHVKSCASWVVFSFYFECYLFISATGVLRRPTVEKVKTEANLKNYNSQSSWNDEACTTLLFWICEKK